MHRAGTEVEACRAAAVARRGDGRFDQLVDPFVFDGGDRHDRHAQLLRQASELDGAAVGAELIHHIKRHDHGNIQLDKLHTQIEIALDICSVHDIDDAVRVLVEQKIPRDDFFARIGGERIDARQVDDRYAAPPADLAVLALHRHAREVADMLVGAGQLVKERRLAAVLVARQCEYHLEVSSSISISRASSRRNVNS